MRDFVIRPKDQEIMHAPIEIHQSYLKKKNRNSECFVVLPCFDISVR